jgi:hypothetical protein
MIVLIVGADAPAAGTRPPSGGGLRGHQAGVPDELGGVRVRPFGHRIDT